MSCEAFTQKNVAKQPAPSPLRNISYWKGGDEILAIPGIDSWLQSAVREIVRNPLFTGIQRWNASRYLRDPDTGKDRRRLRPATEWITKTDESLRIIPAELFQRAQRRHEKRSNNPNLKSGRGGYWFGR